jgi:hypothetical protein
LGSNPQFFAPVDGTNFRVQRESTDGPAEQLRGGTAMPIKGSKLSFEGASSDGIMAEVSLGVTVTSLYALVGLGVVLAFM